MHLNFVKSGRGPVVVLAHALGCDLSMWDEVAQALEPRFTVLRYDMRGHGRSDVPPPPYTIELLAEDAAALITEHVGGPVHFVGLSMGGMVAQMLAARRPELVRSIVVAMSSSWYDDSYRSAWKARIDAVLTHGMASIADGAIQRWFTPEFRQSEAGARRVAAARAVLERTDPRAYAACCEAISGIEFCKTNPAIWCPTLVVAGARDEATPPAMSGAIRDSISGAQLVTMDTAHLGAVERPAEFASLVTRFLQGATARQPA
jgi:3-oxoadipate enol-lactonase